MIFIGLQLMKQLKGKQEEMDELELKKFLEEKRKDIKSFDDLVNFLKEVKDNYNTGYGTSVRSSAQACLAVAWYFASEFGLTGFQAGCLLWDFIVDWRVSNNKTGLAIIDYDEMLYPQDERKFKTISSYTWEKLQEEAKRKLKADGEDGEWAHPRVREHWQSIVDGVVPFGYEVED